MMIRKPFLAGRFYPADPQQCRTHAARLFSEAARGLDGPPNLMAELPDRIVVGIVPHAGWVFSGEPAARTLEAIARTRTVATFVVLGAFHNPKSGQGSQGSLGALFERGTWRTPMGDVEVDDRLAEQIEQATDVIRADPAVHGPENSIEAVVPLIQFRFPQAKIVPILVRPASGADQAGPPVAQVIGAQQADAVVLCSTDLTHYGPSYGRIEQGIGRGAIEWAKDVNDAGVIDAIVRLDAEKVMPEVRSRGSACGGGAVAASLAAARVLGATRGVVLEHVTSYEVMNRAGQHADDSVGYLSAVLG